MSNWAKLQGKLKSEAEKRPQKVFKEDNERPLKRNRKGENDATDKDIMQDLLKVNIPQKVKDKYVGLDCEMVTQKLYNAIIIVYYSLVSGWHWIFRQAKRIG